MLDRIVLMAFYFNMNVISESYKEYFVNSLAQAWFKNQSEASWILHRTFLTLFLTCPCHFFMKRTFCKHFQKFSLTRHFSKVNLVFHYFNVKVYFYSRSTYKIKKFLVTKTLSRYLWALTSPPEMRGGG